MLTDSKADRLKPKEKPYRVTDSNNLFLYITPTGNKIWRYRYRIKKFVDGKYFLVENMICLGRYPDVGVESARELRDEIKKQVRAGINPTLQRKQEKIQKSVALRTLDQVIEEWWHTNSKDKSAKTLKCWERYLKEFHNSNGHKPINEIVKQDIRNILDPVIQSNKLQTAKRILWIIRQVCKFAASMDYRKDDPTEFLEALIPNTHHVKHHPAIMEPAEIGNLLRKLQGITAIPSVKYCLNILTYLPLRSSEIRSLEWIDIDLVKAELIIPAGKMKMRKEFSTYLPKQVVALFNDLNKYTGTNRFCFPGRNQTNCISDSALNKALNNLGYQGRTSCHGFRTIFSTACYSNRFQWGISSESIEYQLSHKERNSVKEAYNRSTYWEERKVLIQKYADYIDSCCNL